MSSIVIPPGFVHVDHTINLQGYARSAHVTYGWEPVESMGSPDDVAEHLHDIFTSGAWGVRQVLDSNSTVTRTNVTIGQDGEPLVGEFQNPLPGLRGLTSLPPAMAVHWRKRTALGGRRNQGGMFLPWCLSENQVDEAGAISAGEVAAQQGFANAWFDALNNLGQMVLLHRVGISAVPDPTPVTSLAVTPIISNQVRRQLRRVG